MLVADDSQRQLQSRAQQADTDNDGKLSFEEFAAWSISICKCIQEFYLKQNVLRKQRRTKNADTLL